MSLVSAHWYDFVVLVVLVVGFKIGQHKEAFPQLLSMSHWAVTLVICSLATAFPAKWLAENLSMQPDVMSLMLFPVEFLLVFFLLGFIWRRVADRVMSKEAFGRLEQPVAGMAGSLKYLTFLMVFTAWVSGRYVTEKDIRDYNAFCQENFAGITFPVLCTINNDMFNGSFTGRFAKQYLTSMLLTPLPRLQYPDKPEEEIVATKKQERKLRELNDNFEREPANKSTSAPTAAVAKEDRSRTTREAPERQAQAAPAPGKQAAVNFAPSVQTVYRDLTLKGISGSGTRLFALINDKTFQAGESGSLKIDDRKLLVKCVQVRENSAVIRLEDNPKQIELKLGITADLEGHAVDK